MAEWAISNFYLNDSQEGAAYTSIDTITHVNFTGNKAISSNESYGDNGYGCAIYNKEYISEISHTKFIQNEATHGGAIYNGGSLTIINPYFENNIASVEGGAIFNREDESGLGVLIIIDTDGSSIFKGNTANGVANSIHNEGYLILLAADTGHLVLNDNLVNKGEIYIGEEEADSAYTGTVELNNSISGDAADTGSITFYKGTLRLGKYTNENGQSSYGDFSDSNILYALGGDIRVDDKEIRNYTAKEIHGASNALANMQGSTFTIDVDLMNITADTFTAGLFTGTVGLDINLMDNLEGLGDSLFTGRVEVFKSTDIVPAADFIIDGGDGELGYYTPTETAKFAQDTTDRGYITYSLETGQSNN